MREGRALRTVPVSGRMVLGRSATSDLVLADEDVSAHHAVVAWDGASLRIADLRSTNGTFVNGARVGAEQELADGDRIRLGPQVELEVRTTAVAGPRLPVLLDVEAGLRYAFDADRLHIGADRDCTLRISRGPARAATLLVDPDGRIWLGEDGEQRLIEVGEPFDVAGCRLVLEAPRSHSSPTLRNARSTRYPYRLHATLDGPGGAVATFAHLDRAGLTHQVTSENRAVLLYLLARQLCADRASGADERAGWCDDQDVVVGVWGRSAADQAASALNVLVHRTRKEIEEAGFDPWCIEKRRGATRVRVDTAEV